MGTYQPIYWPPLTTIEAYLVLAGERVRIDDHVYRVVDKVVQPHELVPAVFFNLADADGKLHTRRFGPTDIVVVLLGAGGAR